MGLWPRLIVTGLAGLFIFSCAPSVDQLTGLPPVSQRRPVTVPGQTGAPPPSSTPSQPSYSQPAPRTSPQPAPQTSPQPAPQYAPQPGRAPGRVVVNRVVYVGPGGGAGKVRFQARAGQRLYVTLSAANAAMAPYGHLDHKRGGRYFPKNEMARNGVNRGSIDLRYSGWYTLTVFDGTNKGGQVRVLASLASAPGAGSTAPPAAPAAAQGRVLVNRTVNVAGGGGGAAVRFSVNAGQRVRITLQSNDRRMLPYGHLSHPGGEVYFPPNSNARAGYNSGVAALRHSGQYTLTVFDGTNRGGQVNVKVILLP